jgi:DNA-binding MarR family transcriptional regulator
MTTTSVGAAETDHELQLADEIGMAMARLFRMSACAQAKASTKGGLERSAFVLLISLARNGPCRSSVLAELVFVDPSTVSRQVAGLVGDGLVERRADAEDGRASVLVVTEAGLELLETHRRRRNQGIASVVDDWSEADRVRFAELFERFTVDYEHKLPELLEAFEQERETPAQTS